MATSTNPPQTHYGASFTKGGRLSRRPDGKHYFTFFIFLERLVRFDILKAAGTSLLTDKEIGKVLGKSARQLAWIRNQPPYFKKRMELTTGIGLDATKDVERTVNLHKQQLKMMLPLALRTIYDEAMRPNGPNTTLAERKFKVDVAKDLLDREGTFPKISRTDAHVKHQHSFDDMDGVSKDLLDSVDSHVQDESPEALQRTLAINKAFSDTDTLTAQEMEASLASLEAMKVTTEIQ